MRQPDDEKKIFGRIRAGLMGLLEVPLLERGRKKEELTGVDERKKFFDNLGDSWGSRVVPVNRSIEAGSVVLPGDDVNSLVERALITDLTECYCRSRYRNCDHPTQSCIGLSFGESYSAVRKRRPSQRASLSKVKALIQECNERGLVHQTVYYPSPEYFYVICNCCSCCCIPLNNMKKYGKINSVVSSKYVAIWDRSKCSECLACVSRCVFGALALENGSLKFNPEKCYGCGLCVTSCPRNAVILVSRNKQLDL